MIEKGMTPPPLPASEPRLKLRAVLGREGPTTPLSSDGALRRGVILTFLGLGLGLGYLVLQANVASLGDSAELAAVVGSAGAVVAILGLGNLVYWRVARPGVGLTAGDTSGPEIRADAVDGGNG